MQLVVGRITRPHGVHGEVSVEVRTDEPDRRFAVGRVLPTDPAAAGPLTVDSLRWHSGRLLIQFAGVTDRNQAEELRGTWLTLDSAEAGPSGPPAHGPHPPPPRKTPPPPPRGARAHPRRAPPRQGPPRQGLRAVAPRWR